MGRGRARTRGDSQRQASLRFLSRRCRSAKGIAHSPIYLHHYTITSLYAVEDRLSVAPVLDAFCRISIFEWSQPPAFFGPLPPSLLPFHTSGALYAKGCPDRNSSSSISISKTDLTPFRSPHSITGSSAHLQQHARPLRRASHFGRLVVQGRQLSIATRWQGSI